MLYLYEAFSLEPLDCCRGIFEHHISLLIALVLPRLDKNHIAFPEPQPSPHPSRNPAVPCFSVKAFYQKPAGAKPLLEYAEDFLAPRQAHPLNDCRFGAVLCSGFFFLFCPVPFLFF